MLKLFLKMSSINRINMKSQRGFTLIELLVVIAIIGILSSVVLASLNTARTKARDARRVSDIKQLQIALELYYDSNGTYPSGVGNGDMDALNVLVPTYIASLYTYYYWSTGNVGTCGPFGYTLWYRLEMNSNGNAETCVRLDTNSFTLHP